MTIVLLSEKLTFLRLATGKIHPHDAKWAYTMCGKAIPDGTQPLPYRRVGEASVCKLCVKSLHTYTGGAKRLNATPLVQFVQAEQEQA